MDLKALIALLTAGAGLAAWGAAVEVRLYQASQVECKLKQHTIVLNWIGDAIEAKEAGRPIPHRTLLIESDCGS